jgi:hypothetical protein
MCSLSGGIIAAAVINIKFTPLITSNTKDSATLASSVTPANQQSGAPAPKPGRNRSKASREALAQTGGRA